MMNIADMLNPTATAELLSPSVSPKLVHLSPSLSSTSDSETVHGKPRSRFSELEDAVICEGVAKGLTWGQISNQLPHRKRATCFNRYRTLQGIRKSRKRSSVSSILMESKHSSSSLTLNISPSSSNAPTPRLINSPTTPTVVNLTLSPSCSSNWTPTTPPSDVFLSSFPVYSSNQDPLIRRLSLSCPPFNDCRTTLPPIYHQKSEQQRPSRPTATSYLV